ncbi:hypothetical protein RMR16_025040 (plasmid) [Agrobacterium sp. rho-13.3]|uniref:hypothetical protein n=1 Tax=Agrobacterium sp. rho-13.3 TaxID=3072980 RepID=UPI002A0F6223|nr:hypothetical protein [Agrobacterium sp. rho-13.3]MDX8310218.1 hypothetical protein [Agrobacterium sp. rho-13.3]
MALMDKILVMALVVGSSTLPANAQLAGGNQTCGEYLKTPVGINGTPKFNDVSLDKQTAENDAKLKKICEANPEMNALQAARRALSE